MTDERSLPSTQEVLVYRAGDQEPARMSWSDARELVGNTAGSVERVLHAGEEWRVEDAAKGDVQRISLLQVGV